MHYMCMYVYIQKRIYMYIYIVVFMHVCKYTYKRHTSICRAATRPPSQEGATASKNKSTRRVDCMHVLSLFPASVQDVQSQESESIGFGSKTTPTATAGAIHASRTDDHQTDHALFQNRQNSRDPMPGEASTPSEIPPG